MCVELVGDSRATVSARLQDSRWDNNNTTNNARNNINNWMRPPERRPESALRAPAKVTPHTQTAGCNKSATSGLSVLPLSPPTWAADLAEGANNGSIRLAGPLFALSRTSASSPEAKSTGAGSGGLSATLALSESLGGSFVDWLSVVMGSLRVVCALESVVLAAPDCNNKEHWKGAL